MVLGPTIPPCEGRSHAVHTGALGGVGVNVSKVAEVQGGRGPCRAPTSQWTRQVVIRRLTLEHHRQLVQHVTNGSLLHTVCDKKRHENGRARRPDTQRGVGVRNSARQSHGNSERSVHRQHETQRACRRDQSDRGNVESNMASAALGLEPSISAARPLAGGGEVMSAMVLAYPEHRAKAESVLAVLHGCRRGQLAAHGRRFGRIQ